MNPRTPPFLTLWVLWFAFCALAGWTLSALHALNPIGYAVAIVSFAAAMYATRSVFRERAGGPFARLPIRWRRFRRPLPFVFLLLAGMSLIGGSLYAPNNYDALAYRLARILHWLAEGQWHWVTTPILRINLAAANTEWLYTPMLALLRSDRLLFLASILSFVLLPGLIFSVFRLAGVRARVAWAWMWLLPAGQCFVMQSGGIGNDLLPVTLMLAALHYALVSRRTRRVTDVWLSVLAAALLSGCKASNLPLLLPWLLALWPSLPLLRSRLAGSAGVALIALVVSFAPVALLNQIHAGHWTGDPVDAWHMNIQNPFAGVVGNGLQLLAQGSLPPVMPGAGQVEKWIYDHLPIDVTNLLKRDFQRFALCLREVPQEETAGLGLAVTGMIAGSFLVALFGRRGAARPGARAGWLIGAGAGVAFAVFLAKMGSEATARLLMPYYPVLLLPLLLLSGHAALVRRRGWNVCAVVAAGSALIGLILTPSRPLFPAITIFTRLAGAHPGNALYERALRTYTIYRHRNDGLAVLRAHIPDSVYHVGAMFSCDDPDLALWRPFGRRRVWHLVESDLPRGGRTGVEWVMVRIGSLSQPDVAYLGELIRPAGGRVVAVEQIALRATAGAEAWAVVKFDKPAGARREP